MSALAQGVLTGEQGGALSSAAGVSSGAEVVYLLAPLSGVLVDLALVPDPVFAQKMAGDGVSLDPSSSELLAPLAGRVTQLHASRHALTITTAQGLEVLLHIGVDTVALKGEGFVALVAQGDTVVAGQVLVRFDRALLARKAPSVLTQMLVVNTERVARWLPQQGAVVAGQSLALAVELRPVEAAHPAQDLGPTPPAGAVLGPVVVLPNLTGLHARPAALLAARAKAFASDIRLLRGMQQTNAKSLVGIMALGTVQGDALQLSAQGPDAAEAVRVLSALLAQGSGEVLEPQEMLEPQALEHASAQQSSTQPLIPTPAAQGEGVLVGVSAAPGVAVGRVVQWRVQALEASHPIAQAGEGVALEGSRLAAALLAAGQQIEGLKATLHDPAQAQAQILAAQQALLEDPEVLAPAQAGVGAGQSAAFAWRAAFEGAALRLEQLSGAQHALLRERANDVRDVGQRVLRLLLGAAPVATALPPQAIVVAEGLTPSELTAFARSEVRGVCTTTGGATSHVAILARALGIAAVCGVDAAALRLPPGREVVLDGTQGLLYGAPDAAALAQARTRMAQQSAQQAQEQRSAQASAVTTDGLVVEVVANVRNAQEAQAAVAQGAQGVGLLRTEFLFDERSTAPSEDEQTAAYAAVIQALGPQRVCVARTLDAGGDKPLAYAPLPHEDNPFLGLRGLRVSLAQPALFRTQLRALLRAAPRSGVPLHVMFPMVALVEEFVAARALLRQEQQALGLDALAVRVGLMVEVPSAALLAQQFAREADFLSIGTNDLTQYTLAMDRGHPQLAAQADALHPAVLQLIALTCAGARVHGKWVGVCGALASDRLAVPVLLGLGVRELSAAVPAVAGVKAAVRRVSLAACEALAREVLALSGAAQVRARLAEFAAAQEGAAGGLAASGTDPQR